MTAPEPTTDSDPSGVAGLLSVDTVAPEPDEPQDEIEFITSGGIRAWVTTWDGDKPTRARYRLRRPFLGELRELRGLHEMAMDEISDHADEAREVADQVIAEANALGDGAGRSARVRELRRRSNTAARALNDFREEQLVEWWASVFKLLSIDGAPPEWPTWAADQMLTVKALNHWRSVPLGRGG